jgi:superfamily I DNA/RNA helicase
MNELDLYGPPGTGKTTRLTQIALQSVQVVGPHRLGAVTYTRTAATELKLRLAAALGIHVPDSPQAARRTLDANMPWVGTIHSLAYRLIGRPPLVSGKDATEFARSLDPRASEIKLPGSPDDVEGYEYMDVQGRQEVELSLQLHAMARHRMLSIPEAARYLSDKARMEINIDRLQWIAYRYEEFKADLRKIDFEDMLETGRQMPLPVSVLLCDEVQDNSALLWSTIDAWAPPDGMSVMAGDPWQAIYLFSGASPELFRNREGTWKTIGNSHRLSARTAAFALQLLRSAGYEDDSLLSTWEGVGGSAKDSTSFYLARTNNLLLGVRERLEEEGTPYRLLRGTGPLQMKAAQAFRAYKKNGDQITPATAHAVAESLPKKSGIIPHGLATAWSRLAADGPEGVLSQQDLPSFYTALDNLPYRDYYERVMSKHGMAGFVLQPKVSVGTIHAAKGREADEVTLVRSWAYLPGRRLYEGGRKEEACVAYVGATRHRTKLSFLDGMPGIEFPFPPALELG